MFPFYDVIMMMKIIDTGRDDDDNNMFESCDVI